MLTFVACKKEAADPLAGVQPARENLETRIIAFVERASNGARDGGEVIAADSAEWYVEAALNFSNADLTIEYNDAEVDSITYTIPLDNGMANEADAIAAYNTLNPIVGAGNVPDVSHVVVVDVTSQNTVDELILTVAYVVGSGYEKALDTNYGPNDYWLWYGWSNCNCKNPPLNPPPSGNNLCADKRIQSRVQQAINNGQYVYMVNIETWIVSDYQDLPNKVLHYWNFPSPIGPNNPVSGDGIRDYRIYACTPSSSSCVTCLDPADMSFYTQGAWDVMEIIRQQRCPTKVRNNVTIEGEIFFPAPTLYFHMPHFRYGVIPK